MPTVYDPNQDEDQTPGGQANLANAQQGMVTGNPGQAAAGGAAAGPDQKATKSGSWSNLMSYIDANKGNDTALGERVKGTVDAQAKQADEIKNSYQTAANTAISANTVKDSGVLDQLKNDPTKIDKAKFQTQYNASYNGPQSADQINNYAQAYQQANNVQGTAKLASGDQADRIQLLDKSFARPSYSQGERQLDSFILGGGEGGQQKLKEIGQNYGNYGDQFKSLVGGIDQNINQAKVDTAATKTTTQQAANEAKARFDKSMADAKAASDAKNQADRQRYEAAAAGDQGTLEGFGYDKSAVGYLKNKGFDFNKALAQGSGYGIGDVADQNSVAGYKALLDLMGGESQYDLAAKGGTGVTGRKDMVDAGNSFAQLDNSLRSRLGGGHNARGIAEQAWSNPDVIQGMDPAVMEYLRSQSQPGRNPFSALAGGNDPLGTLANYIDGGTEKSLGDVIQGDEGLRLNSYANMLGLGTQALDKKEVAAKWKTKELNNWVNAQQQAAAQRTATDASFVENQNKIEAKNAAKRQKDRQATSWYAPTNTDFRM